MADPIRVLVVDDSAFMRGALVRRIESDSRFKVVGTAGDGLEGVEKALRLRPDVVTLDVEMPVLNGLEALRQIVARSSIPVVMVSSMTQAGAKTTVEALALGAADFIPKSNGAEFIHEKLFAAANLNGRLKATLRDAAAPAVPAAPSPRHRMRPRSPHWRAKAVVMGSSTGGPKALQQVLSCLPARLPVPIFIAQHMPQPFTAALAHRLNELCEPNIVEAANGMQPVAGTVYIAPGGVHLRIGPTGLKVSSDAGESIYRPSVGILAASAGDLFGGDVVGVMLTGLGNDGAKEFAALHEAGALVLAQDQATCAVYGMPRAVIEGGATDEILPLERIGTRLRTILCGDASH